MHTARLKAKQGQQTDLHIVLQWITMEKYRFLPVIDTTARGCYLHQFSISTNARSPTFSTKLRQQNEFRSIV